MKKANPGCYPNTDLCVDLKTYLRHDRRALLGKDYSGVINRDDYDHFTFVEIPSMSVRKRNPHVFNGRYITITRRDDGTLNLNFKRLPDRRGFNITNYSVGVCLELQKALNGLVEKKKFLVNK